MGKHTDFRTGRIGGRAAELEAMIAQGMTAPQIADVLDVNAETVRKHARKRSLTIARNDAQPDRHPAWKGGTTIDRQGYVMERVDRAGEFGYLIRTARRDDPRGYAPQHRVRMHQKLGRPLLKTEVVHHIDGDVANNDPANLEVFACNADHLRATLTGKCPNWTDDGKRRIAAGVQRAAVLNRKSPRSASTDRPRTDDPA